MHDSSKFNMFNNASDNVWEDLAISILSVYQYKSQNTYLRVQSLKEVGIFNPNKLARWNTEEITDRLRRGDCNRANFMTLLFAERLSSLGQLAISRGIHECEQIFATGNKDSITEILIPVRGIEPKVLQKLIFTLEVRLR